MNIIAFIGRAGAGKDYQCSKLVEQGYVKLAFADALRDIAYTSLDIKDRSSEHYDKLKANNCIQVADSFNEEINGSLDTCCPIGHYLNFRKFLELLGTQGIRKYDNDFWCRCLIKTIQDNRYENICVSDMRFINEYNYLRDFAMDNNYDFKVIFCDYHSERYQENNTHESAQMGNYFAENGYKDLQEIKDIDMKNFYSTIS